MRRAGDFRWRDLEQSGKVEEFMTPAKWIVTILTSIVIAAGTGWIGGISAKGNDLESRVRAVENKAAVADQRFINIEKRMDEISVDMKIVIDILRNRR